MANGHFLLFILRQREKSAISVRKKTQIPNGKQNFV